MLHRFISDIDKQVKKNADDDKKISDYYKSDEFAKIKETCNSLNVSRKEFNEYIEEKAQSIAGLFGTRVVRNETQHDDIYDYIRSYKNPLHLLLQKFLPLFLVALKIILLITSLNIFTRTKVSIHIKFKN